MAEPLTFLIVDDEPLAVELLVGYVERTPGLVAGGAFTDPIAAFRRLEQGGIDVVLTDIRMPELSGLQLIKLAGPRCVFIIVSAHPEHAIDGFELDVADYLQKPASYERFMRAIDKVHVRRTGPTTVPTTDHFFLKCGHELVRLDHDEVLYISAMRDYVAVHTRARGRFLSLEHLRDLEARLPAEHYCRIHRSHIVRLSAVEKATRDEVRLAGTSLPISESYAQRFRAMLKV
jgi:DNA-binding LytR/AlgR family response regulator